MYLFLDTETTGLTHLAFASRNNYRQWPRLLHIAWALGDAKGIHSVHDLLILPANFNIPPAATAIHGITNEMAQANGVPLPDALQMFHKSLCKASVLIGHNYRYDIGVLQSECFRHCLDLSWPKRFADTQHLMKAYLKHTHSTPIPSFISLARSHILLFGKQLESAHNARSDMLACAAIFYRLLSEDRLPKRRFQLQRLP